MSATTELRWQAAPLGDAPKAETIVTAPEERPQLDAATGIAAGLMFGIGAWCLFALAVVGLFY